MEKLIQNISQFKLALLALLIIFPLISSAICFITSNSKLRKVIVTISTIIMLLASALMTMVFFNEKGPIEIKSEEISFLNLGLIIKILDIALILFVVYIGIKIKKYYIPLLAIIQLIPMLVFEALAHPKEAEVAFVIDYLAMIMILLVSVIGPIIVMYALGYMEHHEEHLHLKKTKQPKFFMVLFLFLGAMNALSIANDILWLYFFWEVTTLCSFLLISHDGTEESINNAARALWINLLGGLAFVIGIILIGLNKNTVELSQIIESKSTGGIFALGIGLLCFAGFTKAAQIPFQSWLCGAMVAPTPVSALLHSSTMVKAGVYLVVRLSPVFIGTLVGNMVAIVGGFTFMAASAMAISQRNAKKVLAYSTIANLGLIICCAGIGSGIAIGAAILLIIFHAVSKALLFLCVGTIEQGIGSRDIEDMQGLMKIMPFTTIVTVIGMISMLLPPFGVLITKWLAIEAAVKMPLVLLFIVIGSAFTVVFWSKWIGIILTMSYKNKIEKEKLSPSIKGSLSILLCGVIFVSMFISPIYQYLIKPQVELFKLASKINLAGNNIGLSVIDDAKKIEIGGFSSVVFFAIFLLVLATIPLFLGSKKKHRVVPPYTCGALANDDIRGINFYGPMDKVENIVVKNYYLTGIFGEKNLTLWANLIGIAIILVMFGVTL